MEIWQYIEVLRQPDKIWFSSKGNIEKKIEALSQIANDGYPSLISSLIEFLQDKHKEVRDTACRTIIYLFKKIDSKKGFYDTLKHCSILESDIDFYESTFPTEQFVELLAICSLNGNGYIREKAVKKLIQVENPRALQFLIYRLADWVLPVRIVASKGIENYKSVKYIDNLIKNLPIFEWLQKVERADLSEVHQDIIEFIATKNRDYVIANFSKYPDKLRLVLGNHISNSMTDLSKEIKLFLSDKHFLIRNLANDHFEKLGKSEIDQLLNDKSAKVRFQTLYGLKDQKDFENKAKIFLADNSATIRHFARFTLKQADINFADFYHQNLQDEKAVIGSLIGLAEVEAGQFSETVKMYLDNKRIKIKKTAFLTLCKLDKESAYEFAYANLDISLTGLRNIIIDFLSVAPRLEALTKAREIYKTGNYELKKSMLKLFNKIGSWTVIPDLMIGTIDENENIRQMAFAYLQTWKNKAVRLFSVPRQEDTERAMQIFNFAQERHKDKQYFETSPLIGLDFYFK